MIVLSAGHYPAYPNPIPAGESEHELLLPFTGAVCAMLPVYATKFLMTQGLGTKIDKALEVDDPTMFVEFHLNVGGGTGPECWYHPNDAVGKVVAQTIQDELHTSWEGGRGIRPRTGNANDALVARNFGWLRRLHRKAPSVIVELCFRDNVSDLNKLARIWHEYVAATAFGIARAEGAL